MKCEEHEVKLMRPKVPFMCVCKFSPSMAGVFSRAPPPMDLVKVEYYCVCGVCMCVVYYCMCVSLPRRNGHG